jgi:2'-5' RNA ligase
MFVNKGKRDILIFPKFDNISKIQEIRNKYDELASLVSPHITVVFPFIDNMSDEELIEQLSTLLKERSSFCVTFKGISLSDDNYIFLNCTKGNDIIINLHDEIYKKILPNHLKKSIPYVPHITLGQFTDIDGLSYFDDYEFTTIIDEISVELIGDNEESIIIKNIKLKR